MTYRSCLTLTPPINAEHRGQGIVMINHPNPDATVFLCLDREGVVCCEGSGRDVRLTVDEFVAKLANWFYQQPWADITVAISERQLPGRLVTHWHVTIQPAGSGERLVLTTQDSGTMRLQGGSIGCRDLTLLEVRDQLANWYGR